MREALILDMPYLFGGDYNDYSSHGNMSARHDRQDMLFKGSNLGLALDFSDADAELNSTAIVTYPCTLELVLTPSTLASDQFVVSFPDIDSKTENPHTCVYIDSGNSELQFTSTNTANRRAADISGWVAGQTYHVIIVWYYDPDTDANNSVIYVNGVDVTEHAEDYWNPGAQTDGLNFGHRDGSASDDYTGVIDSIKVWDRGLTAAEATRCFSDPWADYREDFSLAYYGAIHGEAPSFSPFWCVGNNQVL
jgi:hypothetical protein